MARSRVRPSKRENAVSLVISRNESFPLEVGDWWQAAAMEWKYVVRTRTRWQGTKKSETELFERCSEQLREMGLDRKSLVRLGEAAVVEVNVRFDSEEKNWAARVMPWEFLLTGAVKTVNPHAKICVVRRLERTQKLPVKKARTKATQSENVLVVSCMPGEISEWYDVSNEIQLSLLELNRPPLQFEGGTRATKQGRSFVDKQMDSSTVSQLKAELKKRVYSVIHFCGVDSHQGAELLEWEVDPHRFDGLLLADRNGNPREANAIDLAPAIGESHAEMVVFNVYNSAGRLAALTVANGATAALGFQDENDDRLAELFISDFYRLLSTTNGDIHASFITALELQRDYSGKRRGSGIVLWHSESVFSRRDKSATLAKELYRTVKTIRNSLYPYNPEIDLASVFSVEVLPRERLNYSVLHNDESLFEYFKLIKKCDERVDDIRLEVSLGVGLPRPTYEAVFTATDDITELGERVRLPLNWLGDGGLWDDVRTSILVKMFWKERLLYADSLSVTIPPANEWEDTDNNRQWLPSFIYSRDPLIAKVVDRAQDYLIGATGDSHAGFDGYQQLTGIKRERDNDWRTVDQQVRAIWHALTNDFGINYCNPPPSYSESTQRLRTPSEIELERKGTCIDLALLFAACLEHVDIYPVIFLLQGHAFPGYWRSEKAHERFLNVTDARIQQAGQQTIMVKQNVSWLVAGPTGHAEVVSRIRAGDLVPLETVWLTMGRDFSEAIEAGLENLQDVLEFHSFIDVAQARAKQITPLPIRGIRS